MEASLRFLTLTFLFVILVSLPHAASAPVCPRPALASVLEGPLRETWPLCPLSIVPTRPLEVNGEALDAELNNGKRSHFYSIMFYGSWCPFSRRSRPIFDALSSMFPDIRHLAIEESSALPSIFSRYGVHSFPSILIVNHTRRVHYHGSKDLNSLVHFYKKVTGQDPTIYFSKDQLTISVEDAPLRLWSHSVKEIFSGEPYLVLAMMCIILRVLLWFFLEMKFLWLSYISNLNLGILRGLQQLLDRALHVVDLKRLWTQFRLSNKTRNFQKGASNARVCLSSLASSVSLGESSVSRSSSSDS